MNKGDLIKVVADSANITQSQASDAVQAVFDSIEKTLKSKDKASLLLSVFSIESNKHLRVKIKLLSLVLAHSLLHTEVQEREEIHLQEQQSKYLLKML